SSSILVCHHEARARPHDSFGSGTRHPRCLHQPHPAQGMVSLFLHFFSEERIKTDGKRPGVLSLSLSVRHIPLPLTAWSPSSRLSANPSSLEPSTASMTLSACTRTRPPTSTL